MHPDDPRHGTNVGYAYGQCRCEPCRRAHTRAVTLWRMGRSDALVDATGTRRRIEALMTLGWNRKQLSRLLGHQQDYFAKMIRRATVTGRVAAKVAGLYDRLSMCPAPDSPPARRTKALAARKGFAPPLAWNDIDDPDEIPDAGYHTLYLNDPRNRDTYDEAVVLRILAGDVVPATHAERVEVVRRWPGSLKELERLTGWKSDRYAA